MTSSILIVEDEFIVSADIEERLMAMGYRVAGSTDTGEQAVELAGQQRPDLVLMDIRLRGEMDGITAAEEIRRRFRLPVIFLTAYSEDATLERAKVAEPYGYILKPFDDRELKSTMEIALYRHRTEEEIRRLNRLYDVLSQVNQAVVRTRSRAELLQTVPRLIVERGAFDLAWIDWLEPETGRMSTIAGFGKRSELLSEFCRGTEGRCEGRDKPADPRIETVYVCNDCNHQDCPRSAECAGAGLGFRSRGSFPIRFQERVCGVLRLGSAEPGFLREREVELLKEVVMDISFALDKLEADARRDRAELELRESETKFRSYIEHAPLGVFVADRSGRFLEVNPTATRMLGYDEGELPGRSIPDVLASESLEPGLQDFRTVVQSGAVSGQYRFRRKDGSELWATVSAVKIDDSLFLAFCQDITERKRMEEEKARAEAQLRQVQKVEAIGHLAGGIAHDFNNILSAILGYTAMALEEAPEDSGFGNYLNEVLAAGLRAKELVKQILTFSRQTERELKPVEITYIVKEAVKMLRAMLPAMIDIRWRSTVSARSRVLADPTEIHQVVMNLCTNAAHAMRAKGGDLEVELREVMLGDDEASPHPDLTPGGYIRLCVADTGHGMSEEVAAQIFNPFFTTKPQGEGTGMGLSVTHGIVKNCGGAITVVSKEGAGSTFCVYLPGITTDGEERPQEIPLSMSGKGHILFVDDEKSITDLGQKMLQRMGYSVTTASGGREALEMLALNPHRFDLLFTDYTMSRMTGLELAREAKRIRPGMPVIVCSGHNDMIDDKTAATFDIEGFLAKPFDRQELSRAVEKALHGRQTHR